MRVLKILALAAAVLVAAVAAYSLLTLPERRARLDNPPWRDAAAVLPGAFHVHTTRSDGTGTVEQVAAAAARAGLKFVIFTDHGDATRPVDPPAYRSGVLCLDGIEISTDGGHYAVVGLSRPAPYPLGGEARDVIDDVRRLGGFGVAAHPDSSKGSLRWREWGEAFDAIEWLNGDSEWRDESRWTLARTLLHYAFRRPESIASLLDRSATIFARWDAMTRRRRVVALAASDAHARIGFGGGQDPYEDGWSLELPSYESVFRTFTVRAVLTRAPAGNAAVDAGALLDALRAGHVYSAVDAFAGPARFEFTARNASGVVGQGDVLPPAGPVELRARVNADRATLVLLRNGQVVQQAQGGELSYRAAPERAVYRVEARWPMAAGPSSPPWIVSNPIYVGGVPEFRQEPERPLVDSRPMGEERSWRAERDASSTASLADAPSPDGAPGFVLRFTLGGGSPARQVAAAVHPVTGLKDHDRVLFRARADRPMRVSLELREPQSGARWRRSVYLSQDPRDITVFLDDLRPVGRTSTWRPDMSKVDSLLFVADTINRRPGDSGAVWVSGVRYGR